ncbi:MAG: hypothetical protein IIC95_11110 [Chloroflexi bacterium]|nr:hypothetical protein [Chloroflexota bacterium]
MGFKLTSPDGFVVEVETYDQLTQVLQQLRSQPQLPGLDHAVVAPGADQEQPPAHLEAGPLRLWFHRLPHNQHEALEFIAHHQPQPVVDEALRGQLGLNSNSELAGVMSAVSKNAKGQGWSYNDLVVRQQRRDQTGRHVYYTLTDIMREAVMGGP